MVKQYLVGFVWIILFFGFIQRHHLNNHIIPEPPLRAAGSDGYFWVDYSEI